MNKVIKLLGENPTSTEVLEYLKEPSIYEFFRVTRNKLNLILKIEEFEKLKLSENPMKMDLVCAENRLKSLVEAFETVSLLNNIGNDPDE
tara:strand:- start:276 stop:545 length:270 start_codon:yes stop_codon:yes gene_type:complete